jgi:hypothetical protein
MHSKAATKWTIEVFLCIVVVVAGMIIVLLFISSAFVKEVCPRGQEDEIFKIMNKAKELKGKPGYEIVYFKVKDCVKQIEFSGTILKVQYTTVKVGDTIDYSTDITWSIPSDKNPITIPDSYPFKVSEDKAEYVGGN